MFRNYKNLIYSISEKKDGSMKIQEFGNKQIENRKKFFSNLEIDYNVVISPELVHGNKIKIIKSPCTKTIKGVDGLITDAKGVILTITVADCLPVYFFDHTKKIIGIAHSGWQGVIKNISGKMVKEMKKNYQSNEKDILVYIGPHIKKCHFEVGEDVAKKFEKYSAILKIPFKKEGAKKIDLSEIVKQQLRAEGVLKQNISVSEECTYCSKNKYFSYRRDKPKNVEAMAAYIGLR